MQPTSSHPVQSSAYSSATPPNIRDIAIYIYHPDVFTYPGTSNSWNINSHASLYPQTSPTPRLIEQRIHCFLYPLPSSHQLIQRLPPQAAYRKVLPHHFNGLLLSNTQHHLTLQLPSVRNPSRATQ
ncbi:hypothetical protein KFK09_005501 [Dendrobium nobile]|uniref:Uncharacterized protein n=1 Tax=Dendrobium nobile TaxID=94219 RepID=A0A8T3BYK6_DENNO|nr:hypothetical protein KFK09_005501 [Dendrobium nobile]